MSAAHFIDMGEKTLGDAIAAERRGDLQQAVSKYTTAITYFASFCKFAGPSQAPEKRRMQARIDKYRARCETVARRLQEAQRAAATDGAAAGAAVSEDAAQAARARLEAGLGTAKEAVEADSKGDYTRAFASYTKTVEHLVVFLKNPAGMTSVVAEVETRVRGYVERAEQLKKLLEAERPAAAAAAATCTDAAAAAKVEEEELAAEAQNLLDRGVAKISAAVEKDTAGDLRAAFNMYTMGLGFLSAFLRDAPKSMAAQRSEVQRKMAQYLTRAEALKAMIAEAASDGAAPGAVAVPVAAQSEDTGASATAPRSTPIVTDIAPEMEMLHRGSAVAKEAVAADQAGKWHVAVDHYHVASSYFDAFVACAPDDPATAATKRSIVPLMEGYVRRAGELQAVLARAKGAAEGMGMSMDAGTGGHKAGGGAGGFVSTAAASGGINGAAGATETIGDAAGAPSSLYAAASAGGVVAPIPDALGTKSGGDEPTPKV